MDFEVSPRGFRPIPDETENKSRAVDRGRRYRSHINGITIHMHNHRNTTSGMPANDRTNPLGYTWASMYASECGVHAAAASGQKRDVELVGDRF